MTVDCLFECVVKFGGAVFNPVTLDTLKKHGIVKPDSSFNELVPDDNDPFYIIGFAVNELRVSNEDPYRYPPIYHRLDDLSMPPPYNVIMPLSRIFIFGSDSYAPLVVRKGVRQFGVKDYQRYTTSLLEDLIKDVGTRFTVPACNYKMSPTELQESCKAFAERLASYSAPHPQVATEPQEPPVEAPKKADRVNVRLSREEVLDLLKTERECVSRADRCDRNCEKCPLVRDTADLLAMYDAVIKYYGNHVLQNQKGKYVRMADGSRKWLPNEEAEKLLKLPLSERT